MGSNTTQVKTRYTAPLSPKAPRIYVTDSNSAVESQVRASGGIVIRPSFTPEQCVRELEACDGLLITGGGDVNPAIYGQVEHKAVYGTSTSRDLRELALLGAARYLGLPVMGICRGLQIINVEAGGTLYQDIPEKIGHHEHGWSMMPVNTAAGSLVRRALGERPNMLHLHHQSVCRLAKGFTVTARHADGIVEAIESVDGRVVGVQFHPESVLSSNDGHDGWKLFDLFVAGCARYRRRVTANGRKPIRDAARYVNRWPVAVEAHKSHWNSPVVGYKSTSSSKSSESSGGGASPKGSSSASVGASKSSTGGALVLVKGGKASVTSDPDIAGWCGNCGVAFDNEQDWHDHTEWYLCGGRDWRP